MPVFRWGHAFGALHDLEREMDRLLRSVNFSFSGIRAGQQYPAINLYERADEFLLTAELPGTHPDDLELSVSNGVLTMRGKQTDRSDTDGSDTDGSDGNSSDQESPRHKSRREESEIPEDRYRRRERRTGDWERSLNLPDRIQEEKMEAEFVDGGLCLHLPKIPESKPRHIPVIAGNDS